MRQRKKNKKTDVFFSSFFFLTCTKQKPGGRQVIFHILKEHNGFTCASKLLQQIDSLLDQCRLISNPPADPPTVFSRRAATTNYTSSCVSNTRRPVDDVWSKRLDRCNDLTRGPGVRNALIIHVGETSTFLHVSRRRQHADTSAPPPLCFPGGEQPIPLWNEHDTSADPDKPKILLYSLSLMFKVRSGRVCPAVAETPTPSFG